ncbi:hypothetical protein HHI36_018071 [Cryptolaemus montrouzieri]|uniref:Uncharacterized protein n=1 Tax=Cryptolaemus montrouzieri TaxID=559131 RepID=A0ABD2NZS6_9CUCU
MARVTWIHRNKRKTLLFRQVRKVSKILIQLCPSKEEDSSPQMRILVSVVPIPKVETSSVPSIVAPLQSKEVCIIEATVVSDTTGPPQTENFIDTEPRDVVDTIARPLSHLANEVSNDHHFFYKT